MRVVYFNFNGELIVENKEILSVGNRSFRYGDALFETMLWKDGKIRNLNAHVKRLQHSMEVLKLQDVPKFNAEFIENHTQQLITKNGYQNADLKVRLQVYRDGEGAYGPLTNKPGYILEVSPFDVDLK